MFMFSTLQEPGLYIWRIQSCTTGLILGLLPANEGRRYKVTLSLIGGAQTYNQPCTIWHIYMVIIVAADGIATNGATPSAGVILIEQYGVFFFPKFHGQSMIWYPLQWLDAVI